VENMEGENQIFLRTVDPSEEEARTVDKIRSIHETMRYGHPGIKETVCLASHLGRKRLISKLTQKVINGYFGCQINKTRRGAQR
jgi:hypothetical protein